MRLRGRESPPGNPRLRAASLPDDFHIDGPRQAWFQWFESFLSTRIGLPFQHRVPLYITGGDAGAQTLSRRRCHTRQCGSSHRSQWGRLGPTPSACPAAYSATCFVPSPVSALSIAASLVAASSAAVPCQATSCGLVASMLHTVLVCLGTP